jgi:chromosome partitioning protein
MPLKNTALALFDDAYDPYPDELLIPTPFKRITLLPGTHTLDRFNTPEPEKAGPLQRSLRAFLREVEHRFDVILIDCPPNLHLCSWNALVAADFVMVPLQAEDFGAQGIPHIQRAIDFALETANPKLKLLGYLVTLRQRLSLHDVYEQQLRKLYGPMVFDAVFPSRKDFKEAIAARSPIHCIKPRTPAAAEVKAIANEILRRVPEARSRPPEFLRPEERQAMSEAGATATPVTGRLAS